MRKIIILCSVLFLSACSTLKSPKVFCEKEIVGAKHQVKSLDIGHEALLTRLNLIRKAQKEIMIQTFIWAEDDVGVLMFYELLQAAKRGVKVKIIADHMFSMNHLNWLTYATVAHPNLEIRLYNPQQNQLTNSFLSTLTEFAVNFKKVNSRMHNKVFIADDYAITGGRNIENCYYDRAKRLNFKDRDVMVKGPIVERMKDSFNSYWDFPWVIPCKELRDVARLIKRGPIDKFSTPEQFGIKEIFEEFDKELADSDKRKELETFTHKVKKVAFFADPPGKNNTSGYDGSSRLNETLVHYIGDAKESVVIQSPYLVMSQRGLELFAGLREKNPQMELIFSTNSLAATDSWPTYALFYKQKKELLDDLNCQIYEYKPIPSNLMEVMPKHPDLKRHNKSAEIEKKALIYGNSPYLCLHGKTLVVDHEISFIGSYNLDPRSANLNTEVKLAIWDEDFANSVINNIADDCAPGNSWLTWKKDRIPVLKEMDDLITSLSGVVESVTTLDLWPSAHAACFELKEGKRPVKPNHPDFYKNYQDVGNFPELATINDKSILVRLFRSLGQVFKPLL